MNDPRERGVSVGEVPSVYLGRGQASAATAAPPPVPDLDDAPLDPHGSHDAAPASDFVPTDDVESPAVNDRVDSPTDVPTSQVGEDTPPTVAVASTPRWRRRMPRSSRTIWRVLGAVGLAVLLAFMWPLTPIKGLVLLVASVWYGYVAFVQFRDTRLTPTRATPKRGVQLVVYVALRAVLIYYTPRPGKREIFTDYTQVEHRALRAVRVSEWAVINPKGGAGKSTVAVAIAYLSAKTTQMPTLIVDSRPEAGSITERVGLWRRDDPLTPQPYTTITVRQAMWLHDNGYLSSATQSQVLIGRRDDVPLFAIASDTGVVSPIDVRLYRATMDELTRHYGHTVHELFNAHLTDFDLEVLRRAKPIFVHNTKMSDSRTQLSQAITAYCSHIGWLQEKITRHGVLIVLCAERGVTADMYSKMFHGKIPPERVVLVPEDKYFVGDHADPGHNDPALRDLSRPPTTTLDLPSMPVARCNELLGAANTALRTTYVRALNRVPVPVAPD